MRILLTNDDVSTPKGWQRWAHRAHHLRRYLDRGAGTDRRPCPFVEPVGPLRLRRVADKHYALGNAADCVIMGIRQVMDIKPDLVLSGINSGSNVADDVTYSGTIAGAIEGTLQGVRSFALSQAYTYDSGERVVPWEVAETHAPALLDKLLNLDLPVGTFLNLNFPNCRPEEVAGTEVTSQGNLAFNLQVDERADGRGFPYYWLRFGERSGQFREGTDIHALKQKRISVTPLKLDLTDYSVQDRVARALGYGVAD